MGCSHIRLPQGTCRTLWRSSVLRVENCIDRLWPVLRNQVGLDTRNPGLARVMRYSPTRSPPRITRQYMPAIVTAILMEQAATLPQYTASGSKSTSGIIISPRPTRRAFLVPSVLMLNSHIIGSRCWPVSGTNWKQLLVSNFVSSVSIANLV